jgi:hypothetical protein
MPRNELSDRESPSVFLRARELEGALKSVYIGLHGYGPQYGICINIVERAE